VSETTDTPTGAGDPSTVAQPAATAPPLTNTASSDNAASWSPGGQDSGPAAIVADRPEIAVGASFAGGLVLALMLKRLAR
jgi:hypothetical protein